jgi:hypothetical protein
LDAGRGTRASGSSRNRVVDASASSADADRHEVTLPSGVFRRGAPTAYAFVVYNGIGGRVVGRAEPQAVRRLAAKDGVAVIAIVGSLSIAHLGAGKYALDISVSDRRCGCATTQTVDLELQ